MKSRTILPIEYWYITGDPDPEDAVPLAEAGAFRRSAENAQLLSEGEIRARDPHRDPSIPSRAGRAEVVQRVARIGGEEFGYAVARVGDVNSDGIPDFAVGAPLSNAGGADSGRICLFWGGPSISSSPSRPPSRAPLRSGVLQLGRAQASG